MAQYLSTNPNYLTTVMNGSKQVIGNSMAKLSIQVQNKWVNIMEAMGFSEGGSGIGSTVATGVGTAMLATGNNFLPILATSQVWRASTGVELTLDMRFDAVSDPVMDVLFPVQTLISMWMPTRGGATGVIGTIATAVGDLLGTGAVGSNSFLHPPGPTPAEFVAAGGNPPGPNTITVMLGSMMVIKNLLPVDLQWEFENRFGADGNPRAAMVRVTMVSFTLPDANEMLSFFTNSVALSGASSTPGVGPGSAGNPARPPTSRPGGAAGYTPGQNQSTAGQIGSLGSSGYGGN